MHRTTVTVATARLLAIIALFLVIVQGTATGLASTPEAEPPDGFVEIFGLGVAALVPQEAAQQSEEPDPQGVALTKVVLDPGESLDRSNPHWGSSVLFVEVGTICYQIEHAGNASLRIFASPDLNLIPVSPVPASATENCTLPPEDCMETIDGCDLVALGLTDVVVHEGQTVIQSAAPLDVVNRGYTNVGEVTAVIWIAQVQTVTGESAPCGGGCP